MCVDHSCCEVLWMQEKTLLDHAVDTAKKCCWRNQCGARTSLTMHVPVNISCSLVGSSLIQTLMITQGVEDYTSYKKIIIISISSILTAKLTRPTDSKVDFSEAMQVTNDLMSNIKFLVFQSCQFQILGTYVFQRPAWFVPIICTTPHIFVPQLGCMDMCCQRLANTLEVAPHPDSAQYSHAYLYTLWWRSLVFTLISKRRYGIPHISLKFIWRSRITSSKVSPWGFSSTFIEADLSKLFWCTGKLLSMLNANLQESISRSEL